MTLGSTRFHIRIECPADDVWALVGAPERLHEWFPGMTSSTVEGSTRIVTLGSGLPMPEEILVNDRGLRRFQYRVMAPMFTYHRGTIDVLELDARSCLVVYATEADPRTMALLIGAGTADALDELKRIMETTGGAN